VINASGAAAHNIEKRQSINIPNTAVSFVTPGVGKKLFGTLAGPSALEELHAIIPSASPFFGVIFPL